MDSRLRLPGYDRPSRDCVRSPRKRVPTVRQLSDLDRGEHKTQRYIVGHSLESIDSRMLLEFYVSAVLTRYLT